MSPLAPRDAGLLAVARGFAVLFVCGVAAAGCGPANGRPTLPAPEYEEPAAPTPFPPAAPSARAPAAPSAAPSPAAPSAPAPPTP